MGLLGAGRTMGTLLLVGLLGVSGLMGGCNKVNKKQYDLAVQEAAELRERNAQLDQQNRDQAARIAELEARGQQQPAGNDMAWNDPNAQDGTFFPGADGTMVAEIAGSVLFDSGSATLKSSARSTLDKVAAEIKSKYGRRGIRVEGHTDTDPIRKSNWGTNERLSQARAEAVRTYLVNKGIASRQISAVGFGSSQPKGTKAASRRVEIVILQN